MFVLQHKGMDDHQLIITASISLLMIQAVNELGDSSCTKDEYILKMMLAACKKAVTNKWLKPVSPTQKDWIKIINGISVTQIKDSESGALEQGNICSLLAWQRLTKKHES